MKNLLNYLSLFFLAGTLLLATSCGDDDPIIDVVDGINVADGLYITAAGVDPTTAGALAAETVEDDGFSSQARSSFVANYVYLEAGDVNVVEIVSKAIVNTIGGTATTVTDEGSGCDYNDYMIVATAVDGANISVAASGLYKVTHDATTSELMLYKIENAGLIGSATPGGWGSDTELGGSVTADGGSWTATGVTLREGEFKLRFNCRWNLDRRIDPTAGFGVDNGYQLFTNFGGSPDNLLPGNDGANMSFADIDDTDGIYDVEVSWDSADGFRMAFTRTGDAPVITFVPDEHQWGIIGDATATGWDADIDLNYEGFDAGTYRWVMASVDLVVGGFKFRANDLWDENIGWGQVALAGDVSDFTDDGGNIKVNTPATYMIVLTTSDEGATYTATFTEL